MRRPIATALAVVLLAAGCAGSDEAQGPATKERGQQVERAQQGKTRPNARIAVPPTAAERDWLFLLGEWTTAVSSGGVSADSCSASLRDEVGTPPSRRLERLRALASRACRRLQAAPGSADGQRLVDSVGEQIFAFVYAGSESRPLPVIGGRSTRSRIEPRLSKAVSAVTGRPSEVRCWTRSDWDALSKEIRPYDEIQGYVPLGGRRIHLIGSSCAPLVELYQRRFPKDAETRFDLASALNLLSHEAQHRLGVANEAKTECFGVQTVRRFARELGAPDQLAATLSRLVWTQVYPRMSEEYRSPHCRDGGRFDLNPNSSVFP
jgi:hypothetical protein